MRYGPTSGLAGEKLPNGGNPPISLHAQRVEIAAAAAASQYGAKQAQAACREAECLCAEGVGC